MSSSLTDGKVRVAQVVTRFIAGAGGVALRGALALDPDRYAVTIMGGEGGPLFAQAEAAGIPVVRLRELVPELDPRADLAAYRELLGHLRRGGFDLVHTHSAKAGTIGRLAARRAGVPALVHTFHGFPFHDFQSAARRRTYIAIERRLGRQTDQFLAVGNAVAAQAICLGIASPERIRATPCTIERGIPAVTPERRAAARLALGLPAAAPVVGTVGRLDAQKAPLDFVDAAARIASTRPAVRFVWIGDGPLRAATQQAIDERGLSARFTLLGERRDVPDLLPALDVFAMASLYEGLPCALAEAMMCGIPATATSVNGVPELVVQGRTGLLVPPARPAALAEAVGWLLDHPTEAWAMAERGRELVGDSFEPAALGHELDETYRRALGGSHTAQVAPVVQVS